MECKTTDRLSRRAYPRGYTETLEERIRQLESENTKLNDLLGIKQEELETLSNHNHNSVKNHVPGNESTTPSTPVYILSNPPAKSNQQVKDIVKAHFNVISETGVIRGSSTGFSFMEAFAYKLKTKEPMISNKLIPAFISMEHQSQTVDSTEIYQNKHWSQNSGFKFHNSFSSPSSSYNESSLDEFSFTSQLSISSESQSLKKLRDIVFPTKSIMDKLITVFFQEWGSILPIFDQDKFLKDYISFIALIDHNFVIDNMFNKKEQEKIESFAIQLLLCISLSSLVIDLKNQNQFQPINNNNSNNINFFLRHSLKSYENQWIKLINQKFQNIPTSRNLQILLLIQLYYQFTGNYQQIWKYRILSVNMAQRLGLHKCPKTIVTPDRSKLTINEQQKRRHLFWIVYSLDCFAAAILGAPRLINERDVECALPTATMKISSGLTDDSLGQEQIIHYEEYFFQFSRVFAKILDTAHSSSYFEKTNSYKSTIQLEQCLESWRKDLPESLKFELINGRPSSTGHQNYRAPLFSLMYHYAFIMIHLPEVSVISVDEENKSGDSNKPSARGSASYLAVVKHAKIYLQVFNYMNSENIQFTLPLNSVRMSLFMGLMTTFGAIDYSKTGALLQDVKKCIKNTLEFVFNYNNSDFPGRISLESYQALEEVFDGLLSLSPKSLPSIMDKKRKSRSFKLKQESFSGCDQSILLPPASKRPRSASPTLSRKPISSGILLQNNGDTTSTIKPISKVRLDSSSGISLQSSSPNADSPASAPGDIYAGSRLSKGFDINHLHTEDSSLAINDLLYLDTIHELHHNSGLNITPATSVALNTSNDMHTCTAEHFKLDLDFAELESSFLFHNDNKQKSSHLNPDSCYNNDTNERRGSLSSSISPLSTGSAALSDVSESNQSYTSVGSTTSTTDILSTMNISSKDFDEKKMNLNHSESSLFDAFLHHGHNVNINEKNHNMKEASKSHIS